jgi:hypothetical protein
MNPETILQDPAASYWLKGALEKALPRDPIDALNDAEILVAALRTNLQDRVKQSRVVLKSRIKQFSEVLAS